MARVGVYLRLRRPRAWPNVAHARTLPSSHDRKLSNASKHMHRETLMQFIRSARNLVVGAVLVTGLAASATAQDLKFVTIGTGGTAYTYYPVGGVIANAISKPPGSRPCEEGGSCGVDGPSAAAAAARRPAAPQHAISSQGRDSGFAQSDVAYWAY